MQPRVPQDGTPAREVSVFAVEQKIGHGEQRAAIFAVRKVGHAGLGLSGVILRQRTGAIEGPGAAHELEDLLGTRVRKTSIGEDGGYQLMPEWSTHPANHYLPRRKTRLKIHPDELERVDDPRKLDAQLPRPGGEGGATIEDAVGW